MRKRGCILFAIGAAGYPILEILVRGWSHWTMALAGGVCLALIDCANRNMRRGCLAVRALCGAGIITLVELLFGVVVNCLLGWDVWDYSARALNLWGQICFRNSAYWFLLCLPLTCLLRRGAFIRKAAG